MGDELLVFRKERLVRRVRLGAADLVVGRGADVDLALDGTGVSRRHLVLHPTREGWRFEDKGSTNGVRLNGRTARAGRLREGDTLEIGENRLVLLAGKRAVGGAAGPLEELFLATARIGRSPDHATLLGEMLDQALAAFEAERGLILLPVPDEAEGFRAELARGLDPAGEEAAASQTIAREVAETGRPVLLANSHLDGDVYNAASIEASSARSILCAPLLDGEEVLGVVYLDGPAATRLYGDRDLQLLSTFALHVGTALQQLRARRSAEDRADRLDQLRRRTAQDEGRDPGGLVARSPAMRELVDQLEAVAARDTTVLVLGESGTGKELVARAIHERSPRRDGPFVPVNCMALVADLAAAELFGHERGAYTGADEARAGRFELADGGTLFLDEVGELSLEMQVRLLRVLQERCFERVGGRESVQVDVRVVAATNRDMKAAIAAGEFREDLWYRLNVFTLGLPPLRERPEDVPPLVEHFVEHFRVAFGRELLGPPPEVLARLESYGWPGNVRELRNVVERAFVLERGEAIGLAALPADIRGQEAPAPRTNGLGLPGERDFHRAKDSFERAFLARALAENDGNMTAAGEACGLPRKTIYRKLKEWGVRAEELADEAQ